MLCSTVKADGYNLETYVRESTHGHLDRSFYLDVHGPLHLLSMRRTRADAHAGRPLMLMA